MTRAAAANRVGSTFSRCSLRRSPLVSCSLITPLATCLTLLIGLLLPAGLVPRETRARSLRDARASRGLASTLRHPLGRSIRDERITKEAHAHARRTNMQKTARNNHALSPHRHVLCKRYLSELARGRPALPQAGYDFITVGGGLPGLQGFFTFQWFLSCVTIH